MKGCECGARVFIYLREEQAREREKEKSESPSGKPLPGLSKFGWLEEELAFLSKDKPVSIDFDAVENLRIVEHGTYELDIVSLMKGEPLVVKSDKGVYYIKLPSMRKE